ncbi:hypothetical protein SISNIDRAFT_349464 [Sistotremastrum niveocremeum HHB9708]|uniref:HD domain-containing protein n=1 Tax=Sistotremastrum niveocremeum HHB9708 TaxID=1314777 RepID=A0A164WYG4_9AGAM|nr:hypothetical protein SISNIDRAFT_349464 [Sistotremastrum niveocremeum HHB9708]
MAQSPVAISNKDKIEILFQMLAERGQGDYIGEKISQLEHSLQAAYFTKETGADDETVIAALLHDVGQFIPFSESKDLILNGENVGRRSHETLGEQYLRQIGFTEKVCRLVGAHVVAKKYLTAVDPSYHAGLSDASKKSLILQGGPFTADEVKEFEKDPYWKEKVQLRKWDDAAKLEDFKAPGLDNYADMAARSLVN